MYPISSLCYRHECPLIVWHPHVLVLGAPWSRDTGGPQRGRRRLRRRRARGSTAAHVAKKKAEALEAKAEQLAMELDQKRLEMVSAVTHASQQAGETKKVWRLAQVQGGEAFGCVCLSVCRKCGAWCVVRGAWCVVRVV